MPGNDNPLKNFCRRLARVLVGAGQRFLKSFIDVEPPEPKRVDITNEIGAIVALFRAPAVTPEDSYIPAPEESLGSLPTDLIALLNGASLTHPNADLQGNTVNKEWFDKELFLACVTIENWGTDLPPVQKEFLQFAKLLAKPDFVKGQGLKPSP